MNNINNNLYSILNINKTATIDDIKKSYRRLALIYHPDKPNGNKEEFIKICSAYEILSNYELRKKYDNDECILNYTQFDSKKLQEHIDNFFLFFSRDNKYTYYINNHNYTAALSLLIDNLSKRESKSNLNIKGIIKCKLIDRFDDRYSLVSIERISRENIDLYVPLRNSINIFYDKGEIDELGRTGDIILETDTIDMEGFYIKDSDIYRTIHVDEIPCIYEYTHIDASIHHINKKDLIEKKYIVIHNIGLPCDDGKRGDLVIEFSTK
jgi:DnaJ-class molecular chaperone